LDAAGDFSDVIFGKDARLFENGDEVVGLGQVRDMQDTSEA